MNRKLSIICFDRIVFSAKDEEVFRLSSDLVPDQDPHTMRTKDFDQSDRTPVQNIGIYLEINSLFNFM
jgi:hypothetical protein